MTTLIISGYGVKVSISKGSIKVSRKGESATYSLADVDEVMITTSGALVTTKLIKALSDAGIPLIITTGRGWPVSILHHPFITRTTKARRGQYEAIHNGKAYDLIASITESKIRNQAGLLRRACRAWGASWVRDSMHELVSIADSVRGAILKSLSINKARDKARELEAKASRIYWGAYASLIPKELGFKGRNQDGDDPVNTSLNYGYGILYARCWSAAFLAGLDPYAGFIHVDRSGKPVLTFDLIEPFRQACVDYPLLKLFREGKAFRVEAGSLTPESRVKEAQLILKSLETKFRAHGEVRTLSSWIKWYARNIASFLRGEEPLKNMVFRW